jgi:hypothetical protein
LPQRDFYHDAVKNALIKDGWTITHDPLILPFGGRNVYVDLGAEAPIGAEKDGRKIAVEVKGFLGISETTELERALGQYWLYRFLLERREPDRVLFMAVSREAYARIFNEPDGRDLVVAQNLKLLVFDPTEEVVVQWIE